MNHRELFPTYSEFHHLIGITLFSQEEIDIQKEIALRLEFSDWDDYLKFLYNSFTSLIDIEGLKNELGKNYNKETNEISGSLPILINKHKNQAVIDDSEPFYEKINALPTDIKNPFKKFETKLIITFYSLLISKFNHSTLELINAIEKDHKIQIETFNSGSDSAEGKSFSMTDAVVLPHTNAVIKKHVTPNFYFPELVHLLKTIHDELVALKFIEPNVDFEKTFENQIKPFYIKPTQWLTEKPRLFYLLYCLSNNDKFHRGISIDKIANQLFIFENVLTPKKMYKSFERAFKQFNDVDYQEKKMCEINTLLIKLSLK